MVDSTYELKTTVQQHDGHKINPQIIDFRSTEIQEFCDLLEIDIKNFQSTYFYNYLKDFKCTHIVVEEKYYSQSFFYDYSIFHVFKPSSGERFCKRFSFFNLGSKAINSFDEFLKDYIFNKISLEKLFIGTVVIKPVFNKNFKIGVVLFKTYTSDVNPNSSYTRYFNSIRRYKINILGKNIEFSTSILIGQDEIGLCATSSLFCITHWLSANLDTQKFYPGQLTKYIGKNFGTGTRSIPSQGLTVEQICGFLEHLKLTFEKFEIVPRHNKNDEILNFYSEISENVNFVKELINSYNSAGFPILLGIRRRFIYNKELTGKDPETIKNSDLHNAVCVGYREKKAPLINYGNYSQRIDRLFVNDDSTGPSTSYNFIELEENSNPNIEKAHVEIKKEINKNIENYKSGSCELYPTEHFFSLINNETVCIDAIDYLLIPTPREITVRYTDIHNATNLLSNFVGTVSENIVRDISLVKSNDYKAHILSIRNLKDKVKNDVVSESFSKYVWVTRLSDCDNIPILDIIFDSNESPHSPLFIRKFVIYSEKHLKKSFIPFLKKIVFSVENRNLDSEKTMKKILKIVD